MTHTKYARAPEGTTVEYIDHRHGIKTAGALMPGTIAFVSALKPSPEYTYTLVNAMGYSEYYGANSNTDWYGYNPHLDFNGLLHAPQGFGENPDLDKMQGRDWPYGYPTYYGATVFAHHKNQDPQQLGFGDVIHVAINAEMKRVELVKRVFNAEAEAKGHTSILDRIRSGERVDVSMGCRIPWDACSICTDWETVKAAMRTYDPQQHKHPGIAVLAWHKRSPIRGIAVTMKEYCPCMTKMRGQILPDGRKVFVYNDFPRFFDISFVWIGADRTARVMWYLDSKVRQAYSSGAREEQKVAGRKQSMDKEIPGVAQAITSMASQEQNVAPETLDRLRENRGAPELLSSLASVGIILKPHEFQRVVRPDLPAVKLLEVLVNRPVTCSTGHDAVDDTYAVSPDLVDEELVPKFASWMPGRSSFAPYIQQRLASSVKTAGAVARIEQHPGLNKLAAQYNGYRLSVLESMPVLVKVGSAALGVKADPGLLQGSGPMVYLLGSHLEPHRCSDVHPDMTTLVSTAPNSSLPAIGAALRDVMSKQSCAGIPGAVRAVVETNS